MPAYNLNASAEAAPYFTPRHLHSPGTPYKIDDNTPTLFTPLKIRDVTLRNRFVVSPMCQYSTAATGPETGHLTDYHVSTLGHYALKGAGLVFIEATGVQAKGRISPNCPGIWDDSQIAPMKRVADFLHTQGARVALQLAHAGRKASTAAPWLAAKYRKEQGYGPGSLRATEDVGGWPDDVVGPMGGPSEAWDGLADSEQGGYYPPRALTEAEVETLVKDFGRAAARAVKAGIDIIEIHSAHGYLLHQFLSPVTNRRTDKYGGSYENRTRALKEIIREVRNNIPEGMPLFLRVSFTDWLEGSDVEKAAGGSWDFDSTLRLAKEITDLGVDLLDVSSGGNHPKQATDLFSDQNYQVAKAAIIRREVRAAGKKLLVGAVGLITKAQRAKEIVQETRNQEGAVGDAELAKAMTEAKTGEPMADLVLVARQFMREPEWVLRVAADLGVEVAWPNQFMRIRL
ncbi:hypothetical protein S40288_07513 [Stachybotrys chartarum IBT 40288]|nr:hypothetical protein S40288_07513 [Stachybotrys chartarum IBT 40288]